MHFTQNYKLKKPELNEYALVTDLNGNADIIDAELLKIGNSQTEVKQQITTHLVDKEKHITAAERAKWDGKVSTEDFTGHVNDLAKHNQFIHEGVLHQIGFGYNPTLGCFTYSIREVI